MLSLEVMPFSLESAEDLSMFGVDVSDYFVLLFRGYLQGI